MKKVMFYCQHVLGMGHFVRSMELVKGLKDFHVSFFNGGEVIPGFPLPPEVDLVQMVPLESDENFKEIRSTDGSRSLAEIKRARVSCLLDGYERLQPDILVIELFPFGRKQFAFELVPLLARIRRAGGKTQVVCSLRDILVSRKDEARHEQRVCVLLNRYFDAVLVHADPRLQTLEETFHSVDKLTTEIHYTGYVAEAAESGAGSRQHRVKRDGQEPMILVSVGGGRVGYELLAAAISASSQLAPVQPHKMLVFTGPYLPDEQFSALQQLAANQPAVTLERYTAQFVGLMAHAQLSVSMAGYNTCMNILTTDVPALVLPFTGGDNSEQTVRAKKLEELGAVTMLTAQDLEPVHLARKMAQALKSTPPRGVVNLRGVENTAAILAKLAAREPIAAPAIDAPSQSLFRASEERLRAALDRLQQEGRETNIFLRDDDIDDDEETLRQLLDVTFGRGVPVNLEVIPATLSDDGVRLLRDYKGFDGNLVELHQHGWRHVNHETAGKKCEFGAARSFDDQLQDIAQGKARLEELLEERFFPAFTPPWNRCTDHTLRVLDQLGFQVFSADKNGQRRDGDNFREISITLDLYRWKGGAALKAPEEIIELLIEQMSRGETVGLLLHHKVMDGAAFSLLDFLLAELRGYDNVKWRTLGGLLPQSSERH